MRALLLSLLLATISVAAPPGVLAQDEPPGEPAPEAPPEDETMTRYRALVGQAIQDFDGGHYEEALALFEQAFELRPSARVLRGIGKVHFERRRYVEAFVVLERALVTGLDPLTDAMRVEVETLRDRAARYVGELSIEVSPTSARVMVDGHEVEDLGAPLRVDVGEHTVAAEAEGHQPLERRVEIIGGHNLELTLDLVPDTANVVVVDQDRDTTAAWTVGSLAVALIGATVGSAIWAADRIDASTRCNDAEARGITCVTASQIGTERDAAFATLITSSALSAAAIVSFVVLLVEANAPVEAMENASVACAPLVDGAACFARGAF